MDLDGLILALSLGAGSCSSQGKRVSAYPDRRTSSALAVRRAGVALALVAILATFGGVWGYCLGHFSLGVAVLAGWIVAPATAIVAGAVTMLFWTVVIEKAR